MYILGLATMLESSAALIEDGNIVAAVEEERFSRHKHEGCFPLRSIDFCLKERGITLADVDHIGIYWQPWRVKTRAKEVMATAIKNPGAFGRKLSRSIEAFSFSGSGKDIKSEGSWIELFYAKQILRKNFGNFKSKIHYLDHHNCHIAGAFFVSPFEDALILSYDGGGEEASTVIAVGEGNSFRVLRNRNWPNSLGHFYSAMTGFLGFQMLDGEYKMMGLAPYNTPDYAEFLRKEILITDQPGSYRLNSHILDYHQALKNRFGKKMIEVFGEPRGSDNEPFTERHEKIASSAQAAFEEVALDLVRWGYDASGGKRNICITGGCGLNCTANHKILQETPFEKIYVPPAPHDAGCSLGAALLIYHDILGQPRKYHMDHAYYGPSYSDQAIANALSERGIRAEPVNEDALLERTATALADGKVIAWFQGRMEFGPRALGSRSFLADPRNESIRDTINEKIKKRELFRPFAPSVKEECAFDYFEIEQTSPFMNIVAKVRPEKRNDIPAVTHVDGTARIQTVKRNVNPRYWGLIDQFERKTGVPVLLNTSFNIQEPIVCSPEEAISTYLNSKVDMLAIGNYLIERNGR